MAYTDRLPNNAQMSEMIYQQTKHWLKADETGFSTLEIELAAKFASMRTGKVFATKEWRFGTNTTSTCEKQLDSVGLSCEPSTDTVDNADDFLNYLPFQWWRCNYTRDAADGFARPTAMEGTPAYRESGAVDVGTLAATFYWRCEDHGTYRMWYMSDSPHPELGLAPWCEAVKADGTVMPYYIYSAFPSVVASDSKLRSQPGLAPAYNQSYNSMVSAYQSKGAGYWGAGGSRNAHGYLFLIIKYATKNSQKKFAGCTNFNYQPNVAYAETDAFRVLIADTNTQFYKGMCVSVGSGNDRAGTAHNVVNRAKVKSVETVTEGGTNYIALNLDIDAAITTTTAMYVSTMPCFAGETDAVIGKKDGSYLSNTDARHTYRIHGVEYNWGQWCTLSDTVIEFLEANTRRGIYVAPRGVAHVANARTGYVLVGEAFEAASDSWIGDELIDEATGAMIPEVKGTGDSVGVGDRFYCGTGNVGDKREYLSLGALNGASIGGLCRCGSWAALSNSFWFFGSCD